MKYLFCIGFLFVFSACGTEDKKIPDNVMQVDKMKLVMWDLLQAGNYATIQKEKDTSIKQLNTAYMVQVLQLYKISKDDFFKSFDYYQTHPELNKILFDSINAYSQRKRGDLYKGDLHKKVE
ncbi:DUF4296 domain-containing protein [Parafilimonas terrae]|uniref:DUF4296 domain-containing protein n=1 Tax=Parafilimonas terrae TaxID=1465490 RepID=A0A1I5SMI3_9BACT|nr:DUF4296 domain-containing protein [Parafilimonas terrae]SFP71935.1 protein of unknown function [Parafilimonas terrae]